MPIRDKIPLKKAGPPVASVLTDLGLHKDYPLRKLIRNSFQWQHDRKHHIFRFRIPIPERNGALLRKDKEMSSYRFIIILAHGNPEQKGSVRLENVVSEAYSFAGTGIAGECRLELSYSPEPGKQWLFCLRAECLEAGRVMPHEGSRALLILDRGKWV
jgi:hypothetical protein